jgi:hypothetical protein
VSLGPPRPRLARPPSICRLRSTMRPGQVDHQCCDNAPVSPRRAADGSWGCPNATTVNRRIRAAVGHTRCDVRQWYRHTRYGRRGVRWTKPNRRPKRQQSSTITREICSTTLLCCSVTLRLPRSCADPRVRRPLYRDNQHGERIASPELLPSDSLLPHLKCSPPAFGAGVSDEVGEHGYT